MEEKIICAAIWYDNNKCDDRPKNLERGFVVCGRRHHNIITVVYQLSGIKTVNNHIQGFMTNTSRFVNRMEAMEIAYQARQVSGEKWIKAKELFSEDLY